MPYDGEQWGRLLVVRWSTPQRDEVLQVLDRLDRIRASGARPLYVSMTTVATSLPDEAARGALLDGAERLFAGCEEVHFVLGGTAFVRAIIRSVFVGVGVFQRHAGRTKVHDTLGHALRDLARRGKVDGALAAAIAARFPEAERRSA